MKSPFEQVPEPVIVDAVADGWGLTITALRYLPVGAGAYHWTADDPTGTRWFVTCDDLDTKPWLGPDRDTAFHALLAAYRTASELRGSGLEFVAAPVPGRSGLPAVRVDDRHSVTVLEHLDGEPGAWGRTPAAGSIDTLVEMLGRLHASTRNRADVPRRGLEIPDRHQLESALADLDHPWDGGPFSEPARRALADHASDVQESLTALDRVADRAGHTVARAVLTHGEPHPGNLVHTPAGMRLLDWDTVAFAPPERDLWMLGDASGTAAVTYGERTGTTLDPELLHGYRLLWALADLASYTADLRRAHEETADAARALDAIHAILAGREPSPYDLRSRTGDPARSRPTR